MIHSSLSKVAVALDTSDFDEFTEWCAFFGSRVGVLKVGLEAFVRWGAVAVECAQETDAEVFLDLKLHDIPATVAGAVGSAAELGVSWLTVHASGGPTMLSAAAQSAAGRVKVIAVTVLTSLAESDMEQLGWPGEIPERVTSWAKMAETEGCSGVVTSPKELADLRVAVADNFRLVTPGIRPSGAQRQDQSRVATPRDALRAGSDLLVMGRPLTRAPDREQALEVLAEELAAI